MVDLSDRAAHELSVLSATLVMMYEELNDATMLDLPAELVEAMDNAKGVVDELKRTLDDYLVR
jgi:hypothetical protein